MRRAFAPAVLGVTAALLVGLTTESITAEIGGHAAAAVHTMGVSLAGLVGVCTALATALLARGHRSAGVGLYALVVIVSVVFVAWLGGRVPSRPTLVLTSSDRAELREFHDEVRGARGIEHPSLGFRLPHPTIALEPTSEIAEEMRAAAAPAWGDAHQIWAFETHDHSVNVVIDLSRAEAADRSSLAAFDRAVTGPLEAAGHIVTRQSVVGATGCLRERFAAGLSSGGQVEGGLFALLDGTRALRLVVTVVSDGSGDWARWMDDVSLACQREDAPSRTTP